MGYESPRKKPTARLGSLRDRLRKMLNPPSASSKEFQEIHDMLLSAPTKETGMDRLSSKPQPHTFRLISSGGQLQEHKCCVQPRKRKAQAAVGCETAGIGAWLPNESKMQQFIRSYRSVHPRMPLEIGKSDSVVIIDCENEKVLNINQLA